MKILIVEDEIELAKLLQQSLEESGYDVTLAGNGREGRAKFDGHDLILADVMMPFENGFQMVAALRTAAVNTPVIFLSAKDSTESQVEGLKIGGDDYISKPFVLAELLARVDAALRRSRLTADQLDYADLKIDSRKRLVWRGERKVNLTTTEFVVLEMLARSAERVISKDSLLREIWDDAGYRDDNLVEVYIRYLRTKLEAQGEPRVIHTVRGHGYVLSRTAPES